MINFIFNEHHCVCIRYGIENTCSFLDKVYRYLTFTSCNLWAVGFNTLHSWRTSEGKSWKTLIIALPNNKWPFAQASSWTCFFSCQSANITTMSRGPFLFELFGRPLLQALVITGTASPSNCKELTSQDDKKLIKSHDPSKPSSRPLNLRFCFIRPSSDSNFSALWLSSDYNWLTSSWREELIASSVIFWHIL